MGKRKLIIGVAAGALLGAAAMQFDKETRNYTKSQLESLKENASDLVSNPTDSVQKLRHTFDKLNDNLASGAKSTVNALDQVENTLNKMVKK